MQKIIKLLQTLPNPEAAWLAIQSELLMQTSIDMVGGAILQTIPEELRNDLMPSVKELAESSLEMFENVYKGSVDSFNSDRKRLYESIRGLLNAPKFV